MEGKALHLVPNSIEDGQLHPLLLALVLLSLINLCGEPRCMGRHGPGKAFLESSWSLEGEEASLLSCCGELFVTQRKPKES